MRVLIVEDDAAIADCLGETLRESGHVVDQTGDGLQAHRALQDYAYDLVVLDLGLPSMNGSEILQGLRQRGDDPAVLVVTARENLSERVRLLDCGADDYLIKPFALTEFAARVRALQRRRTSRGVPALSIGPLRLDLPGRRAWLADVALDLTAREFGLLEALVTHVDRLVSRAQLIEALCSWDHDLSDNGLDISIHRLRRKLVQPGIRIRTVRGLGYVLEVTSDKTFAA